MPENVIDLDVLRPEKKIVKLNGKEIDVSFIPCAITFDLDELVKKLQKLDQKKLEHDVVEQKKAFDITIKMCSIYCKWKYPEMTEEWFRENTSPGQLYSFSTVIRTSLIAAYAGIEEYGKNGEAVK